MNGFSGCRAARLAGLFAASVLSAPAVLADDGPAPRYTYVGAGYEWGDSRCAIEVDGGVDGVTVDASVGIFKFLHLTGTYYDGETGGSSSLDLKCYEVGAGLTYRFAPGADIVLRGNYVKVDSDDVSGSADGFEPQLFLHYALSDKAEIQLGVAYFDLSDDDDQDETGTEVRLNLNYSVLPWLAVRAGGSIFDNDSAVNLGLRAYFGGNLF